MAGTIQCGRRVRRTSARSRRSSRSRISSRSSSSSYEPFLQKDVSPERREEMGLQAVFKSVFPIADYNENASLEFDGYHFGDPKYTVEECHDRGMTFAIPLKVTLRLVVSSTTRSEDPAPCGEVSAEQEVYLGELPAHDREGHLHHQRHRARGGQPAPALGRRVLRRRQGQDARVRQAALLGPDHPLPRLVGGVRVRRQRHPARARRPPAQDARDGLPARLLLPREGHGPLRRGDPRLSSTTWRRSSASRTAPRW